MGNPEAEVDHVQVASDLSGGDNTSIDNKEIADVENNGFSVSDTKKLLRKIDGMLLPFLALLYLLSFLDRSNLGNAKLAKLEVDLKMTGKYDYNTAVAIFFPFYVLSEIPSNLAMKRFRPSIWIPSIMVAWAICTTLMGTVKNFTGLLIVRSFLGLAEGGLFPGITYYITMWYKRHECGLRISIFFSAATAAGAFGGLLARGIIEMEGLGGLNGWAWIFIIEGLATFVVAIAAYKVMHDYPDTARFLTSTEKKEVLRRLEEDRSVLSDEFNLKFAKDALKDWRIWVHMILTVGVFTGLYSISLFLPTIVRDMGYSNEKAQLMSVPPYVVACVITIAVGFAADKHRQRGVYMIGTLSTALIGFILLATVESHRVKYFACFLAATGIYASVPQGTAWNGNNIGGSVKRGVGMAMQVGCGNLGGVLAGFVFRKDDAPRYLTGHLTLVGCTSMALILCTFMTIYLRRENARRDREYKAPSDYTREEMLLESEKGDNATFFRYTC